MPLGVVAKLAVALVFTQQKAAKEDDRNNKNGPRHNRNPCRGLEHLVRIVRPCRAGKRWRWWGKSFG